MKEMVVQAWDDLDLHQDGFKTPADMSVTLAVAVYDEDGKVTHQADVELDLTTDHGAAFWDSVKPWAEAGQPRTRANAKPERKRRAPAPSAELPGKAKQFLSPLDKLCPFAPNTPERTLFLEGARDWADAQGRGEEYQGKPGSAKRAKHMYHYPKALVVDYLASEDYQRRFGWALQKVS